MQYIGRYCKWGGITELRNNWDIYNMYIHSPYAVSIFGFIDEIDIYNNGLWNIGLLGQLKYELNGGYMCTTNTVFAQTQSAVSEYRNSYWHMYSQFAISNDILNIQTGQPNGVSHNSSFLHITSEKTFSWASGLYNLKAIANTTRPTMSDQSYGIGFENNMVSSSSALPLSVDIANNAGAFQILIDGGGAIGSTANISISRIYLERI